MASAFGGGATQTAFGSRGPASFLSKMTTIAAIIFMVTSITLSQITTKREGAKSILETTGGTRAPAKAPAVKTAPPAPTPEQIRQKQLEAESKQAQPAQVQTVPAQGAAKGATSAKPNTPPPAGKKP